MNRMTEKEFTDKRMDNLSGNKSSSLNPAILGVPVSHGLKLPLNMSSMDKQQLMIKLDERRKSRIEKLEARILAKQKAFEKSKMSQPLFPRVGASSSSSSSFTTENEKGNQDRESVFNRLYKNSSYTGHPKSNVNFGPVTKPPVTAPKVGLKLPSENSIVDAGTTVEVKQFNIASQNVTKLTGLVLNNEPKVLERVPDTNKPMKSLEKSIEKECNLELGLSTDNTKLEPFFSEENKEVENEKLNDTFEKTNLQNSPNEKEKRELQNKNIETVAQNVPDREEIKLIEKCKEIVNKMNFPIENPQDDIVSEDTNMQLNTADDCKTPKEVLNETFSKETTENKYDLNETFPNNPRNSLNVDEKKEFQVLDEALPVEEIVQSSVVEERYVENECKVENSEEVKEEIKKQESLVVTSVPSSKVVENMIKRSNSADFVVPSSRDAPREKSNAEEMNVNKNNSGIKSKHPIRRSISMLFRQKSRKSTISRASSDQSLNKPNKPDFGRLSRISNRPQLPLKQPSQTNVKPVKSVSFVTPSKNSKLLSSTVLRNQLEDWLNVHGHSSDGYRHLRCFGVTNHLTPGRLTKRTITEEVETPVKDCIFDESDKENLTPLPVMSEASDSNERDVENWLKELYKLITEVKYPNERCEEWLTAIRKKCSTCTQMPLYWECRAALDESKGDVQSAIENYQTAIIKGKDVESVGDSLANLFDKMVLEQKKPSKCKVEKGIDPKNIFKSTVIKFALQQKNMKESGSKEEPTNQQQKLVATPVRRSSRIRTPSKQHVVSSLQSLTPELRDKVTFRPNMSFLG